MLGFRVLPDEQLDQGMKQCFASFSNIALHRTYGTPVLHCLYIFPVETASCWNFDRSIALPFVQSMCC